MNFIKKLVTTLALASFIIIPSTHGFRDVPSGSALHPAVENLTTKGLFPEGTFFKPDVPVTADLFWEVVLRDSGFVPESATFNTPLPPNIELNDSLAQFLREAIRRKFIDQSIPFDRKATIPRYKAIETLIKTKAIRTIGEPSKAFLRKLGGTSPSVKSIASYLPSLEAAYASNILDNYDIRDFRPTEPLTRRDLAIWLYRYETKGTKKSTINPRGSNRLRENQQRQISEDESKKEVEKLLIKTLQVKPLTTIPNEKIFQGVLSDLENKYRFPAQLSLEKKEKMIEAAITAMVKELEDKFTSYIEPEKSDLFKDSIEGKFEGIGAYVEMIENQFTITAPMDGSPAMKAGVLPGDIVTHVDGKPVEEKSIHEIIKAIKGPAGTIVKLTIKREQDKTIDIPVTRGKIVVPSLKLEFKSSIPIIKIHKFSRAVRGEFEKLLVEEVLSKNPRGVIIDLRNDPGGLLTSAVSMGEFLVDEGMPLLFIEYKNATQQFTSSRKGELFGQKNLVVLQNKGTASASEIFSSIVQDYKLGTIIGTQSFGKGSVQEVLNYDNGGILKVTVAKWLTPKKKWIQDNDPAGIIPDIHVDDPTPEQIKENIDPQLDRAIQHILGRN